VVSTTPSFGRSATVAISEEGVQFASRIVCLHDVSITGAEYPGLYGATAHVKADMLATARKGGLLAIEVKGVTSRPSGRGELLREGDEGAYFAVESLRAQLRELLGNASSAEAPTDDDTRESPVPLLDLAEEVPLVPVSAPAVVELSGNLTRDVLMLTGLTAAELASALGRTERSVRLWIADGQPPEPMRPELQRLRTVALRLVGGLGPAGVRRWLTAGDPSALQRVADGQSAGLLDETERLLHSPAT
jgi:hypothetical protein